MTHDVDVVVIGAGPAGMSAAATAARAGLKTLLLDEQPRAGGQIYRNVGIASERGAGLFGPDYLGTGRRLVANLAASGAEIRHGALVWDVTRDLQVSALQDGRAFQVATKQLIAATGAMERPSPLRGWTLPGFMNAGAAQIAMKAGGSIPAGRVAMIGAGPLLLLVASQLLDAGADVAAIVETSDSRNRWAALRRLPAALCAPEYLVKGMKMLARLRASGVSRYRRARDVQVMGTERVDALRFTSDGRVQTIEVEAILAHHGVIPDHQLSRLLRVDHRWDADQAAWQVVCDRHGGTSLPGFRMAGDGIAIAGAIAAEASGALAALGAAHALGRFSDQELRERSAPHLRRLQRHRSVRPFLDALYRPPGFITDPPDDVTVCRCEEVSAGRIREMAALGCQGPNQTKFFSRCGMGPCQGRVCGTVVTQVLATSLCKPPGEVGAYRVRAPLKPVPVSAIADLAAR